MGHYEYTVVPAPTTVPKIKGARGTAERFSHGVSEALNAMGAEGWEYQRAETLVAARPRGWLTRAKHETVTILIFRRWVEEIPEDRRDDAPTPEDLGARLSIMPAETAAPRATPTFSATRGGDARVLPVPPAERD